MRAASILQTEWWKDNTSKASREAEQRFAHFGKEAVRMKAAMAEKVEDGMNTAGPNREAGLPSRGGSCRRHHASNQT